VFIDGQRMPAGQRLDQLDPKVIDRIEILKGAAAATLMGDEGRNGVIRIYTKQASGAAPPGEP
jgi:outer membrane cobalamin receptor